MGCRRGWRSECAVRSRTGGWRMVGWMFDRKITKSHLIEGQIDPSLSLAQAGDLMPARHWQAGIVIPCKGDQCLITDCLQSLEDFRLAGNQIVVVDGDGSSELANFVQSRGMIYLHALDSRRGYAVSSGVSWLLQNGDIDTILICHADMRLTGGTRAAMVNAMPSNARSQWGWMGHRIDDRRWRYRLVEWGNYLRVAALRLPYGDQLMFVGVDLLRQIGGWPFQPTMEDMELSLRLRQISSPLHVHAPVLIGNRHWCGGIIKTTLRNWRTAWRYAANRRRPPERVTCTITKA